MGSTDTLEPRNPPRLRKTAHHHRREPGESVGLAIPDFVFEMLAYSVKIILRMDEQVARDKLGLGVAEEVRRQLYLQCL